MEVIEQKVRLICDSCDKEIIDKRYWIVRTKDDKNWQLHWNCGLYVRLSLSFIRKSGLLTGFEFKKAEQ